MSVSIYQLGYKKFSRIVFEWQAAERASLLALFILIEIVLHWSWCFFVWWHQDSYRAYVDMSLLYLLWIGVTIFGLFFWWMVGHLSGIKNNDKRLNFWQIVLIVTYSIYLAIVILMMGNSSLFSGISLMGGAMLGMMLVRRRYIWRAFLVKIILIVAVTLIPYLGLNLLNLHQLNLTSLPVDTYSYLTYSKNSTINNALTASMFQDSTLSWESLRRSSAFFWRTTHMYLALPKAIFMVYVFRTLLLILDDSKAEILRHANQDELTGLNNRRFGLTQMQQTLMATKNTQDYSVVLLDLDWFKNINDSYGHEVGDQVLREVAQVLTSAFADKQIVSRYGGEEFLIILPDIGHSMAMTIAEQLRNDIAEKVIQVDDNISFQVTASFGLYTLTPAELMRIKQECIPAAAQSEGINVKTPKVSRIKPNKRSVVHSRGDKQAAENINRQQTAQLSSDVCQRLISTADKALYKAKHLGRNQVVSANEMLETDNIIEPYYGT